MAKKWLSRHKDGRHFIAYDATSRPGAKKWKAPPMPGVRKRVLDIGIEKLERAR